MRENEFELNLIPGQEDDTGRQPLPAEEFRPRHKPFDWAQQSVAAAVVEQPSVPEEDGTVFRPRRPIREYDLPVDEPPSVPRSAQSGEEEYEISSFEPVSEEYAAEFGTAESEEIDLPWPTRHAEPELTADPEAGWAAVLEEEPEEELPGEESAVPADPTEEPDMSWLFDLTAMTPVTEADAEPVAFTQEQRAGLQWLFEGLPESGAPSAVPADLIPQEKTPAAAPQPEVSADTTGQAAPEPEPAADPQPEPDTPASQPVVQAAAGVQRMSNGRTVLISGGDRGIGAAAARAFWQAGYKTAILYHTNEAAARALINSLGSDCCAVRCDVASYEACAAAFRVVERNFGPVDVLVCNAGIAQQKLFTDLTPAEWQRMLDVNLTGAFNLCHVALPGMIRRKWGRILTVSSMWGQTGGSCEVHYSAAKAGLIGLTKALAKEEGPSGITVNCVAPGVIETDMMAGFTAEDKAQLAEETPVGRLGDPAEVAGLLVYLAGEQASFITGQVFGVNGGLVI